MYYRVYRDRSKKRHWRFTLIQSNNRKLANAGEGYKNLQDCLDAIALVQSSAKLSSGDAVPIIIDKKDQKPIPRKVKS